MSGPAVIRLRDGMTFEADDARREGGAILAVARRRSASGPRGTPSYEYGETRTYLWPMRRVEEVVWTNPGADT